MAKRNKIFDITPEEREEIRNARIKWIKEMTMEYQIGYYVGEQIVRKDLPCLDVDMIYTSNVIKVTPEELAEAKRLSDVWYNNHNDKLSGDDDPNWVALRAYHKELEDKYLPKVLTCYIDPFNVVDMEEFKRGVRTALWDCDMCHYNIRENSDIDVAYDEDYYFAIITLKR
jgi:hypothetical protein